MKYEVIPKEYSTIVILKDGYTGTADIRFIENDGFNAPHYSASIQVPFHDTQNIYLHDCHSLMEAIEKTKEHLAYALSRCTLV